jgi:hypothetical protein
MIIGGARFGVGSVIFYAIIILCLIILMYTAYIAKNKTEILTMAQFYKKWDGLLGSEAKLIKFIRHYVEKYFALALKIPGFNFDDPVYFVGSEIVHINTGISSDLDDYTGTGVAGVSTPVNDPAINDPNAGDETVVSTTIAELEQSIKDTIREDEIIMGMGETALTNLGIAVGIQVGISLAVVAGEKFAKTAAGKAAGAGAKRGVLVMRKGAYNAVKFTAKKFGITMTKKAVAKTARPAFGASAKAASKHVFNQIAKLGTRVSSRLGLAASRNLASQAVKSTGRIAAQAGRNAVTAGKAAKTVASKVGSLASKASAKVGMGPAGWVMLGFDVLSIGLDLGDVGGYSMLERYKMIRDEKKKEVLALMKKKNIDDLYFEVGPLDKFQELALVEYEDNKFKAQKRILQSSRGPFYMKFIKDLVFEPNLYDTPKDMYDNYITMLKTTTIFDQFEKESVSDMCKDLDGDMIDGVCSYTDIWSEKIMPYATAIMENDYLPQFREKIDKYIKSHPDLSEEQVDKFKTELLDSVDEEKTMAKAIAQICVDYGGKMKSGDCVYKTKEQCNAHFKMVDGEPDIQFTVWDSVKKQCMSADYAMRKLCGLNQLKYDPQLGVCEMTEALCKRKGAQWDASKKDCYVKKGQQIAEFIFGETITRGLIQVFDPDQYNKCPANTVDHGYTCWKKTVGPSHCNVYGDQWWNNGTQCTNINLKTPANCKPHYTNVGLNCEPNSYGLGVGVTKAALYDKSCPDDAEYHRGVWGAGWCDNGATWAWNLKTRNEKWTPKSNYAYSNSSGVSNEIKKLPDEGWNKCGLLYYPKCPSGTHLIGCNVCRGGPRGSVATGYPSDSVACPTGYFRAAGGGHCYQYPKGTTSKVRVKDFVCPSGTTPVLGGCRAVCTEGTVDTGLDCWKTRKYAYSTKDN